MTASHRETVRHCEDCAAPRLFVAVCLDGHPEGCLDLVCAECGAGYALVPPAIPARAPDALRYVAQVAPVAGSDGDRSAHAPATPFPPTPQELPAEFAAAAAALRGVTTRPEVRLTEAPAPARLAPYGAALTATVSDGEDELAHGRLILLYDPDGHEAWDGCARLVTYIRTELEAELVSDPLLHDVAWHWLEEALTAHGVTMSAASGTVTRVQSHAYGELAADAEDEPAGELEIRASWSPAQDVRAHVEAWVDVLCTAAGLPPVMPGVLSLPARRAR